jgi:hypothetical protein
MKNGAFIDGNVNVWNFLFDRKLDLAIEKPSSRFPSASRNSTRSSHRPSPGAISKPTRIWGSRTEGIWQSSSRRECGTNQS